MMEISKHKVGWGLGEMRTRRATDLNRDQIVKSVECHAMEFEVFLDNKRQPLKDFKASDDQIFLKTSMTPG